MVFVETGLLRVAGSRCQRRLDVWTEHDLHIIFLLSYLFRAKSWVHWFSWL